MIVRTRLYECSHHDPHFTLLQQIEQDPFIIRRNSENITPNYYFFHTVNELLNNKERYIKEITEARRAGYDIAWYSNSTCDITPYGGNMLEYFEFQAGAYHENGIATESKQWNCIDKGLYQPGKTSKDVRLAIIKYLDDANLLHKLDYSLNVLDPNDPTIERDVIERQQHAIDMVGGGGTVEYYLGFNRSMDINMDDIISNGVQHYVGYPYNNHIYANTGWSLITESNTGFNVPGPYHIYEGNGHRPGLFYQDGPMISEKTYRPIMNSHPFVMVGEWGLHEQLKSIGYQTFEKFYGVELEDFYPFSEAETNHGSRSLYDDYESIRNVVSQFYNNISANQDEVREMVTHNKQLLIANYKKTKQWLLDKDEYVYGCHGPKAMKLYDYLWQAISYRNNNGKDIPNLSGPETAPEDLLIQLDQLT